MAYKIYKGIGTAGEWVDGGQTRAQVLAALARHGLLLPGTSFGATMPRFGRMLVISHPIRETTLGLATNYTISHE